MWLKYDGNRRLATYSVGCLMNFFPLILAGVSQGNFPQIKKLGHYFGALILQELAQGWLPDELQWLNSTIRSRSMSKIRDNLDTPVDRVWLKIFLKNFQVWNSSKSRNFGVLKSKNSIFFLKVFDNAVSTGESRFPLKSFWTSTCFLCLNLSVAYSNLQIFKLFK